MKKVLDKSLNILIIGGLSVTYAATGVQIGLLIQTGKADLTAILDALVIPFFLSIVTGFSFMNKRQHKDIMQQLDEKAELREELWAEKALSRELEAKDKAMQGLLSALTSYIIQNIADGQETIEIINPATGEKATITIRSRDV